MFPAMLAMSDMGLDTSAAFERGRVSGVENCLLIASLAQPEAGGFVCLSVLSLISSS